VVALIGASSNFFDGPGSAVLGYCLVPTRLGHLQSPAPSCALSSFSLNNAQLRIPLNQNRVECQPAILPTAKRAAAAHR